MTKDKESAELNHLGVSLVAFVHKLLGNLHSGAFGSFFDKKYYTYLFSPLVRTIKLSMDVDWPLNQSMKLRVNIFQRQTK